MEWPLRALRLRVRDLDGQLEFYRDLLGLEARPIDERVVRLSPEGAGFSIEMIHDPEAPLRPVPSLGLYHFALLLPDRKSLAAILRRLSDATDVRWEGAADHGVSEALYLRDPEGNGVELYRDRPSEEWPRRGGDVAMDSRALDLRALASEATRGEPLHAATLLGHLHFHVADLDEAESFFAEVLGMRVRQRDYPGARFLAYGDYHHHMGTNTWAGNRLAPDGATGLVGWTWGSGEDRGRILARLERSGRRFEPTAEGFEIPDPAGHALGLSLP